MGHIKIQFPCGYKLDLKSSWYDDFEFDEIDRCPLHGKNCTQSKSSTHQEAKK